MRIVHVEDRFWGTFGYQLNFLAKWNRIHGHQVAIVTSDSFTSYQNAGFLSEEEIRQYPDYDKQYAQKYDIDIIRSPSFGHYSSREFLSPKIFNKVEELQPDIVMLHGSDTLTAMRFLRKANHLPYPLITDNHVASVASKNRYKKWFRAIYRHFITPKIVENAIPVIALAEDIKEYCIDNYAIPARQIEVVSWGVDTTLFFPSPEVRRSFRQCHNISESDFVIIYTGKIDATKKVELLARATQKHFEGERNVVVSLVGNGTGNYYEKTLSLLRASENRVIIFPRVPVTELPSFYQAADVAVWPGACSLSFFDAQGCGIPVIAEDIEANKIRITSTRQNGALYKSENWKSLRQEIARFINLPQEQIQQMGNNGHQWVYKNLSYDTVAMEVESIMQKSILQWKNRLL